MNIRIELCQSLLGDIFEDGCMICARVMDDGCQAVKTYPCSDDIGGNRGALHQAWFLHFEQCGPD